MRLLAVGLTLAGTCAASLAAGVTTTKPISAATLPAPYAGAYQPVGKDEVGLWQHDDEAERHLAASPELFDAPGLRAHVRDVLCQTVGADRCKGVRVYIVRSPMFNASMSPNGTMRVLSGLFLRVHSDAELGAVLGHEFGHFEMRHTLNQLKAERSGTNLLAWATVLTAMAQNFGYREKRYNQMEIDVYGNLRRFSRDQEREADTMGVQFLNASSLRPQCAAQVWNTVMREQERSASIRGLKKPDFRSVAFFADHPPEAERAERLAQLAIVSGSTRGDGEDAYRAALLPYLATILRDQIKLSDFGGTDYLIEAMADADGWNAPLYFARGELYRLRGNPRDMASAVTFYQQAIAADPKLAEAFRGLGLVQMKAGEHALGQASLKTYLSLAPDAKDAAMISTLLQTETN